MRWDSNRLRCGTVKNGSSDDKGGESGIEGRKWIEGYEGGVFSREENEEKRGRSE